MDLFGAPGRIPVGPSSLTFYRTLFKEWVTTAAMQSYEIDFMEWFVYNVTAFYATPAGATVWMDGLAQAAAELNVPIQICTATGFDVMQALHYPAVTNVRASPDYRDFPNHLVGPGFLFAWVSGDTSCMLSVVQKWIGICVYNAWTCSYPVYLSSRLCVPCI